MTSNSDTPIIVAGAGIGGLSAALMLALKGQAVMVLEKAPELGEIGYGIQIGPNGYAMLLRMGIVEALEPSCFYPDALVLADALTTREITRINLGTAFRARFGYPYLVVHRRDLQQALKTACLRHETIRFVDGAHEVTHFEQHADRVIVSCADQSRFEGAALVGAEGLRSPTRATIANGLHVGATGHVVYRGLVPIDEVDFTGYLNSMVIYCGHNIHLVQYRLRGGAAMNNVATFESPGFKCGNQEFGAPEELHAAFAQAAPLVRDKLRHFSMERRWVLHDGDPLDNWSAGRVTLLGDAAHPSLQYVAQGAIMAMEDAAVLAEEVAGHGKRFADAFMAYQQRRMNRTARVVLSARLIGKVIHAGGGARMLRNEYLSQRSPDDPWEADWLYRGITLDAPDAA